MDDQKTTLGAITLFVTDRAAARDFYERLFDAEPIFEDATSAAFRLSNVIINLLVRSSADELVTPAHVAQPDSGAAQMLTLEVDDVDAAAAELARKGVALLNGPMNRPWGVRTAAFADADGHVWEIAGKIPA
jgi:catechol 2,3-dioxygenase-like lactoylglutathione lyase family enzyme